jgi:hypothetical protein
VCPSGKIKEAFYSIMRPKVYPVCGQDAVSLSSFLEASLAYLSLGSRRVMSAADFLSEPLSRENAGCPKNGNLKRPHEEHKFVMCCSRLVGCFLRS